MSTYWQLLAGVHQQGTVFDFECEQSPESEENPPRVEGED